MKDGAIRALAVTFASALIMAASMLADGFTRIASAAAPEFEESECTILLPEGRTPDQVTCGYVTVPEDRDRSGGRQIRLAVAVIKSASPDPEPDPILYLSGGPGGPSLEGEMLGFGSSFFGDPYLAERDLVFYDQRGTGLSEGLYCDELQQIFLDGLRQQIPPEEIGQRQDEALQACHEGYLADEIDLAQYTSANSALDIVDVMTALGYDEWNILGVSYGTRLALTAMRDTPQHIRTVLLDSTLPTQVDGALSNGRTFERALGVLIDDCAAHPGCGKAYPGFEQDFWDLVNRANEDPIDITINDPTGGTIPLSVTGDDIMGGTFDALYSTDLLSLIPFAIEQIAAGNTGLLSMLAEGLIFAGGGFADGMSVSIYCNEELPFFTEAALEEQTGGLRPEVIEAGIGITSVEVLEAEREFCADWVDSDLSRNENRAVHSNIPTLVLAGSYDPVTPPEWGELASRTLSNSNFYEFPGTGHGVVYGRSECASTIALQFFAAPDDEPDASCIDALTIPDFTVEEPPAPPPAEPEVPPAPPPVVEPRPAGILAPDTGTGPAPVGRRLAPALPVALLVVGITLVGGGTLAYRRRD
jgi:pimeloyl-ACP methyl ester carboxylesterase